MAMDLIIVICVYILGVSTTFIISRLVITHGDNNASNALGRATMIVMLSIMSWVGFLVILISDDSIRDIKSGFNNSCSKGKII